MHRIEVIEVFQFPGDQQEVLEVRELVQFMTLTSVQLEMPLLAAVKFRHSRTVDPAIEKLGLCYMI